MMTSQENNQIIENIRRVREAINQAASAAGRTPEEITLVAATKMNDAERVRVALACEEVNAAGENRVQEMLGKYEQGAFAAKPLHFIGTLQKNKVKYLIGKTDLIHSVDSVELGLTIDRAAQRQGIRQDILLEINIAREPSKSGFDPDTIFENLVLLQGNNGISIRGLMAIPPIATEIDKNTRYFSRMHQLFIDIAAKKYDNVSMDFLSMGMSGDFCEAIACGANVVRIGSAIFGARDYGKRI